MLYSSVDKFTPLLNEVSLAETTSPAPDPDPASATMIDVWSATNLVPCSYTYSLDSSMKIVVLAFRIEPSPDKWSPSVSLAAPALL
jgi:hypothetical protein